MNIRERIHNILTDWGFLPRPSVQYTSIGWRPDPWTATDDMTETSPGEFTRVSVAGIPSDMNDLYPQLEQTNEKR